MTTELSTAQDFNLIMNEMGVQADTKGAGARLPALHTNRSISDPLGAFTLSGQEKPAFCTSVKGKPKVKFRPLSHHFQYKLYSSEEKKYINWSRQITGWKDEARDIMGTLKCGKPSGKEYNQLTDEQRKKLPTVKNIRILRGLVTMDAVTADGDKVSYVDEPCQINLSGKNNFDMNAKGLYARFDSQVKDVIPHGYALWNFMLDVTAEEHLNDDKSNFWHTMEWSFNPKEPLEVTDKLKESILGIHETIKQENDEVDRKYFDAIKRKSGGMTTLSDDLEDDFESVPF